MDDREKFLRGLQVYLEENKSALKLPKRLHQPNDYVYNSYEEENVVFSVGSKGTGFTVRFLLVRSMLKHLEIVHKQLKDKLREVVVSPDVLAPPYRKPGKERATVFIDCSERNISDRADWPVLYAQIHKYLDVLWLYFARNRGDFKRGRVAGGAV